ncbi:methyl-accepting chemotaxis protein [Bacillus manliponensis]|uniref:methyl-accepting chemotaxis protein n=1 Tax=Bacillus manliponensis TaxID=574376 RepID=UPI00351560FE
MLKRIKKASIKTKLLLAFIVILVLPSITIGWTSYQTAEKSLSESMIGTAKDNVDILDSIITKEIEAKHVDVTYFAKTFNKAIYEQEGVEGILSRLESYKSLHPETEALYLGTNDGGFTQAPNVTMPEGYNPTERSWYKEAVEKSGEVIITAPYISSTTNNIVVTIAKQTDDKSGVIGIDLIMNDIVKTSKMVRIGKEGYVAIFDEQKNVIAHPLKKAGEQLKDKAVDRLYESKQGSFEYSFQGDSKHIVYTTNEKTGWKIGGTMLYEEIEDAAQPIYYRTLTVIGLSLLIGGMFIYFLVRSIIQPLKELVVSSKKISEGDLTETIVVRSNDEVGQLGESFNEMASSLRNVISQINTSAGHVTASSEELTASVRQASEATEQITSAMEQVSSSAETQNREVEEGASLLEEVSKGIQHVADSSSIISRTSLQTKQIAEDGGALVQKTVNQMQSIHQSVAHSDTIITSLDEKSKQIGEILEVIQHIAQQTNLLALNAAIEAARAGEHGRGFAIVADEVRKLAEQSEQSSSEIGKLVTHIQVDIKQTVDSMKEVGTEVQSGLTVANETKQSFSEILKSTNNIVSQINNMVDVSNKMAGDAEEVTKSVNEIASAAEENSASTQNIAVASEEQLASIEEINSAAVHLAQMAEELQEMIGKFKI